MAPSFHSLLRPRKPSQAGASAYLEEPGAPTTIMMEGQQHRGRSSSTGQQPNQRIRHSPSPHDFHHQSSPTDLPTTSTFTSQSYNSNISPTSGSGLGYGLSPPYLNGSAQHPHFQQHVLPSNDFTDQRFDQSYQQNGIETGLQQDSSHLNGSQISQSYQQDQIGLNPAFRGFSQQPDFSGKPGQSFDNAFLLDPQLDTNIQPQGHINPADIMSNMSSPQNMVPTPPNLMPPDTHSSGPTSPVSNQGHQWSPNHSRNASASLDPSAAFNNGQQPVEWNGMQFQGHRRAPSEYSDVSSSAAPSPYLAQQESFESYEPAHSPMMHPQQDQQIFGENVLGIGEFSISDPQQQRNSPRHSPFVSPRMTPEPGLGLAQTNHFIPLSSPNNQFDGGPGSQMYTHQPEAFPSFPPEERIGSNDMGQATQMEAPEINIELAPTTQQPNFDRTRRWDTDMDALSPPESSKHFLPAIRDPCAKDMRRQKRAHPSEIGNIHFTPRNSCLKHPNTRI